MRRLAVGSCIAGVLVAACTLTSLDGLTGGSIALDAGEQDVSTEGATSASMDAATSVSMDATTSASMDAATDGRADAAADVATDAAADAATNAAMDAAADGAADATLDGACTNTSGDSKNCGACGHDCLGTMCSAGLCVPGVLASGQDTPWDLVADLTDVYWITRTATGTVMKCAIGGCTAPTIVASGQGTPYGIAVDATTVYWTATTDGSVRAISKTGPFTAPNVKSLAFFRNEPTAVVVSGPNLLWTEPTGLCGCPLPSCLFIQTNVVKADTSHGLAVDSLGSAGTEDIANGHLFACPAAGCDGGNVANTVVANLDHPTRLALDTDNIFFVTANAVLSAPRTASDASATTLSSSAALPSAIAVDGNEVYFTLQGTAVNNYADGSVVRVDKTGQNLVVLAAGQHAPTGIAVTSSFLVWVNSGDGTVMRVAK